MFSYFVVSCLYVSLRGLINSVGEERADSSAIDKSFMWIISVWKGFFFLLDRPRYFIVTLPWPSI